MYKKCFGVVMIDLFLCNYKGKLREIIEHQLLETQRKSIICSNSLFINKSYLLYNTEYINNNDTTYQLKD